MSAAPDNAVSIRPATAADRAALVEMMAALQEVERAMRPTRQHGELVAADLVARAEQAVAEKQGQLLVAEAGGAPVGLMATRLETDSLEREQRELLVNDIYVAPAWRRHGIAHQLLDAASDHARSLGLSRVVIGVLVDNEAAMATYRAVGFRPTFALLERPVTPD